MTNSSRRFQRSCSWRGPRSSRLLDPDGFYNPLEEASPGGGGSQVTPPKEGPPLDAAARHPGKWGRRAASLRVRRTKGEEAPVGPAVGEAAHSLGPGDGQLLIGEAQGQAGRSPVKTYRKVNRALRQGWQTFLANVSSLTLSRQTSTGPAPPAARAQ
ncbi:uncharacterized protein LOC128337058 isoform X4 [Hemicordylus capensis]|uniref:uncharacterized protein LOC128337058 isoform X4 n=1 Tax=Hemicordylus capensis TaxID=884348 RepID=UPI002303A695|nr:uncharacterized protein LOC128337058 isoform X4 [Hemicordylus capensis]